MAKIDTHFPCGAPCT